MTMRERLIDILKNKPYGYSSYEDFADHLLHNGVILPPCKVGGTVYQTDGVRIYESTINNVIYLTESIVFDERAIGESIYLTVEQAEKALKEREK